ncbi:MAG: cupin-like domain-containing protein [Planctomycetota bacterium]
MAEITEVPVGKRVATSGLEDGWRRWIAENLILGAAPESLVQTLVKHGIDASLATKEIVLAANSPYLKGSQRLQNRLKKRDWVFECYSRLHRLLPLGHQVDVRHRLSRDEFLRDYYTANRPVLITGMMDDWPAMQKWTPANLRERFASVEVEVQLGRNQNQNFESESVKHRRKMPFGEYVDLVVNGGATNDYYMTANNSSSNSAMLDELWKDMIQIPEYLDGNSPQKGFFWFGPQGTITPMHHDLTNNFMAQVYGRKLVRLVPSFELPHVYNDHHVYSRVDAGHVDLQRFPRFSKCRVIDCEIGPGDLLFVPIGWWHYVEGLEISMTIAFTNFIFNNDFYSFYDAPLPR